MSPSKKQSRQKKVKQALDSGEKKTGKILGSEILRGVITLLIANLSFSMAFYDYRKSDIIPELMNIEYKVDCIIAEWKLLKTKNSTPPPEEFVETDNFSR